VFGRGKNEPLFDVKHQAAAVDKPPVAEPAQAVAATEAGAFVKRDERAIGLVKAAVHRRQSARVFPEDQLFAFRPVAKITRVAASMLRPHIRYAMGEIEHVWVGGRLPG